MKILDTFFSEREMSALLNIHSQTKNIAWMDQSIDCFKFKITGC